MRWTILNLDRGWGWVPVALAASQLWIGTLVWRRCYGASSRTPDRGGWKWAILAFVTLQLIEHGLIVHTVNLASWNALSLSKLMWYILLVGYTEELWFRGIWFAQFRNRLIPSLVIGSLAFGLIHLHFGVAKAMLTVGIGAVFAAARYRGASLASLAVAHGLMDWLNRSFAPGQGLRVDSSWLTPMMMFMSCAAAAVFVSLPGSATSQNDSPSDEPAH